MKIAISYDIYLMFISLFIGTFLTLGWSWKKGRGLNMNSYSIPILFLITLLTFVILYPVKDLLYPYGVSQPTAPHYFIGSNKKRFVIPESDAPEISLASIKEHPTTLDDMDLFLYKD